MRMAEDWIIDVRTKTFRLRFANIGNRIKAGFLVLLFGEINGSYTGKIKLVEAGD